MKKQILFYLFLVGSSISAMAQQDVQFSQAFSNPYFFNPAAGGMMNVGEAYLSNRSQWLGVDGKPTTFYGSIASQIDINKKDDKFPLEEFNTERKSFFSTPQRSLGKKHVIGARLYSDQIGPFRKSSAQGTYAIHIPISKNMNMGAGLGVGISNFGIDPSRVALSTGGDNAYLNYLSGSDRQNYLDATAGVVLYNSSFLLSLSTTQVFNTAARFNDIESQSSYARHYYGMVSYMVPVGVKSNYSRTGFVEPFAIAKYTANAPLSYDLGLRMHYKQVGFLSVSYRNQSALAIGVGCNLLENFRFCYSYDIGLKATSAFGMGAHEIQLGFLFGHKRNLEKEFRKDEQEKRRKQQAEEDI